MLGFHFHWADMPKSIKIGVVLWLAAIACFIYIMAIAIFQFTQVPITTLVTVGYVGGALFTIGVLMVIIGLPKTKNRYQSEVKAQEAKSEKTVVAKTTQATSAKSTAKTATKPAEKPAAKATKPTAAKTTRKTPTKSSQKAN